MNLEEEEVEAPAVKCLQRTSSDTRNARQEGERERSNWNVEAEARRHVRAAGAT